MKKNLGYWKKNDDSVTLGTQNLERIKPAEYRLQYKERQLQYLLQNRLPTLLEEKQRAFEILDRGPLGLDNTLYQVEKEMEEKEEQLARYQANASQLQKLQATFEFTANIARQEEKVRRKEKEILESREKQQREALERAVARLERRHSALQRRSTLGVEIEEQRQKLATLNSSSSEQSGLRASLEAEQEALERDQERLEHEIQQLKQKICEFDGVQKGHSETLEEKAASSRLPSSAEKSHLVPLMDARINAYIEEEVQRRLQDLHHVIGSDSNTSADLMKDNEKLHNGTIQRKLKYERMVSRSLGANPDDLKDPIKISIPRYVLCGQGKDEHFEFEVKITVLDETWTVFRRYSRFREMHKTLKLKYAELATLEFPPKKLFGNKDERVVAERRSHLEKYLRDFFSVMLQSATSPLHISKVGLTLSKHTICEFSPFFKKGVFDYSSHGTG